MDLLAESAVRITVLALGVAIVLRAWRICSPRLVHGAWATVVVAMLLLPAFVAWGPKLAVPLLSASAARNVAPDTGQSGAVQAAALQTAAPTSDRRAHRRITWTAVALTVYVTGVGLGLVRLVVGIRRVRAIRGGAVRVHGRLTHAACVTPMTVGIITPVVILPSDWTMWNEAELSAVLAHEEEHARRRDPLVAGMALLNRAIFWFHPLAWWLQRTIAEMSEQACDAVVISRGHDSDVYSACLLRFARRSAAAGGRIAPMAPAIPGSGLRRRLGLLGDRPPALPSRSRVACAAIAGAALLVTCATAKPSAAPAQSVPFQTRSQAAWPVETSEHFLVVHDSLSADRVRDALGDLEAAYTQLSAALKYDMSRRVRVILVRRDGDVAGAGGGVDAPGSSSIGDQRVVISVESLERRTGSVVHELTHLFAFEIVPETSRVAPVLIEGLAEHQRGAWAASDLQVVRTAAAAGAIPTVATLVDTDRHWAHAVFDFVAAQYGDEGVRRLLFALRAHDTLAPAVSMAFGITFDRFEQQFRGYVTAAFGQR